MWVCFWVWGLQKSDPSSQLWWVSRLAHWLSEPSPLLQENASRPPSMSPETNKFQWPWRCWHGWGGFQASPGHKVERLSSSLALHWLSFCCFESWRFQRQHWTQDSFATTPLHHYGATSSANKSYINITVIYSDSPPLCYQHLNTSEWVNVLWSDAGIVNRRTGSRWRDMQTDEQQQRSRCALTVRSEPRRNNQRLPLLICPCSRQTSSNLQDRDGFLNAWFLHLAVPLTGTPASNICSHYVG